MNKKRLCVVMMVFLSAMLFATGNAEQPAATPAEPVKLQVWYAMSGASGEAFSAQADAYAKAHPEVQMEITYSGSYADTATKVSAAMLSGTNPDVAIMAAGQLYTGERGNFDMEKLSKDKDFNIDDMYQGMLRYGMFEDRQAALPYGISTQVMFYNKDILKAAGVDMTNPPKTWDEFVAVAKQAQEKGNVNGIADFYGFDTSDNVWLFKSMLAQNDNKVVEKQNDSVKPVFNDEKGVEVAKFWKSLVDSGLMPAGEHSNAEKKFLSGSIAFIAASSNRTFRWENNTSFELGAIPMPYFKKPSLALGGNVAVILTQDKAREAASWEFLKYLYQEKNQTEFALKTGYLPVRKSSASNPDVAKAKEDNPLYQVAMDQLDNTWAYLHFSEMGTMDNLFWYALDEIEKGVTAPKAALDNAAASLLKEIE